MPRLLLRYLIELSIPLPPLIELSIPLPGCRNGVAQTWIHTGRDCVCYEELHVDV